MKHSDSGPARGARRRAAAASAARPAKRKMSVVPGVLCGADLESVGRSDGVKAAALSESREALLAAGGEGLHQRSHGLFCTFLDFNCGDGSPKVFVVPSRVVHEQMNGGCERKRFMMWIAKGRMAPLRSAPTAFQMIAGRHFAEQVSAIHCLAEQVLSIQPGR